MKINARVTLIFLIRKILFFPKISGVSTLRCDVNYEYEKILFSSLWRNWVMNFAINGLFGHEVLWIIYTSRV